MNNPDFIDHNKIILLNNGSQYFPALVSAIEQAKYEIHLQTYIFKYDATQNSYFPANPLFKTNVDAKIADEKQSLATQIQDGSFHTGVQEIQNGKKVTRPTQTGLRSFLKAMLTQVY